MCNLAMIHEMEEKPKRDASLGLNSCLCDSSNSSDGSSTQTVRLLAQLSLPTFVLNRAYFVCNDSYLVSARSHSDPSVFPPLGVGFLSRLSQERERTHFFRHYGHYEQFRTIVSCAGDSSLSIAARMKMIITSYKQS